MHGKGIYSWPDGRSYNGEYENDRKSGFGVYTWADGRQYSGAWSAGKQHGEGIYKDANSVVRKGFWQEGKRVCWLDKEKEVPENEEQHLRL